jgi:hypothetical protein
VRRGAAASPLCGGPGAVRVAAPRASAGLLRPPRGIETMAIMMPCLQCQTMGCLACSAHWARVACCSLIAGSAGGVCFWILHGKSSVEFAAAVHNFVSAVFFVAHLVGMYIWDFVTWNVMGYNRI